MNKLLGIILLGSILAACKLYKERQDQYYEDKQAYIKCLELEPNIDECVYSYVKYLPEEYKKEME